MFNLLDKEEVLGLSLNTNGIFKKVKASLYDDEPSEALLELGLRSRGLLTSKPDLGILGFNLECIPSAERWNWVLKNVPECLNTTLSMQAMLNDPACRTQMIDRLKKLFSECAFEDQRLAFCEKVSAVYSNLCEYPDGKKLAKTFTHWFLNGVIFTNSNKDRLSTRYINTLAITNHIALVKIFFGKKEKKLLSKKMVQAIQHAIRIKADDQATSTLMALAREDIDLFKKVIIKCNIPSIKIFIDLLNNVTYTAGIDNQDSIISILFEAAKKQFLYHNETFVKTFFEMMNARLEFLAKSSKNAIDEDSSSTSESNSDVIV
jgi:hypothetical protein